MLSATTIKQEATVIAISFRHQIAKFVLIKKEKLGIANTQSATTIKLPRRKRRRWYDWSVFIQCVNLDDRNDSQTVSHMHKNVNVFFRISRHQHYLIIINRQFYLPIHQFFILSFSLLLCISITNGCILSELLETECCICKIRHHEL